MVLFFSTIVKYFFNKKERVIILIAYTVRSTELQPGGLLPMGLGKGDGGIRDGRDGDKKILMDNFIITLSRPAFTFLSAL